MLSMAELEGWKKETKSGPCGALLPGVGLSCLVRRGGFPWTPCVGISSYPLFQLHPCTIFNKRSDWMLNLRKVLATAYPIVYF